ncbi:MAG: hypothetical protein M3Q07_16980 [Pseudobdellovibrionaceae bacterium]|nr:hypothetical protein [Pseudobdellovibrionaceae bacterium]
MNTKVSAGSRVDMLRKLHNLDPNDPLQRRRLYASIQEDRIYCGYCNISVKNKTYNVDRHFTLSESHFEKVFTIAKMVQVEGATLDRLVVMAPAEPPRHVLDPKTKSTRLNFVRHTIRAGIPMNAMDQMREFNTAHYDFSIARMSDMADAAFADILKEEREKIVQEASEEGFLALGFDGTTHFGEASFFVVRYRFRGEVKVKCIAVKHADRSMDGIVLCQLLKAVFQLANIDISPGPQKSGTLPNSKF